MSAPSSPHYSHVCFNSRTDGIWTCISIALFLSADCSKCLTTLVTFTHSHTHSYTDGRDCHARCQLHIRSSVLWYAARGAGDLNQWPSDCWTTPDYLTTHCNSWATDTVNCYKSMSVKSPVRWGSPWKWCYICCISEKNGTVNESI